MTAPLAPPPDGGGSLDDAERLRAAVGTFVRQARLAGAIPAAQAAVLGHLVRSGPMSIAELAQRELVRHQSMARTVGLLAAAALVEVEPDPADRRRVVVRPSAAGAAELVRAREQRAGWIARAIEAELDPEERALCRRVPELLERLAAHRDGGG